MTTNRLIYWHAHDISIRYSGGHGGPPLRINKIGISKYIVTWQIILMSKNIFMQQRKILRMPGFNYNSAGYYYITICTRNRLKAFGEIRNGEMILNAAGAIVFEEISTIKSRYNGVRVDTFVIMPDHVHILFLIFGNFNLRPSISDVIKNFKTYTTNCYIQGVYKQGWLPFDKRLWHRNYYEHVVRNNERLNSIREYIINNPKNWKK